MKVLLYQGDLDIVEKSGVGEAVKHQEAALQAAHIPYTKDEHDSYDIVHINTVFPKSLHFARRARRQGKKVIYYGHSTMEDFKNSFRGSNLAAPLFKRWLIRCYNSSDIIITPTSYSREILQSYGIKKPICAVSNGIDLDKYRPTEDKIRSFRRRYELAEGEKVVMCAGHYIYRKGIDEFIEIARALPQYRFFWFGYTNKNLIPSEISEAIAHKPDNLSFPGYIDTEHLSEAYAGSDLFMFTSREETEGIVLLEAMASRTQVLLRDITIYKPLQEGKEVYKAGSKEEFIKKADAYLKGLLPDLTEAAYAYVSKRSIENVGQKLKNIYREKLQISE